MTPSTPAPDRAAEPPSVQRSEALVERVAELLHAYGTPAHRLERLLSRVATSLSLEARFLSTPTSLTASFGPPAEQRTRLLRVEPGGVDLGKLVEFDELLEELEDGHISVEETSVRVEELAQAPPRHRLPAVTLAFGFASAGAAALFGGGWPEVGVAFLLAAPLAFLAGILGRQEDAARVFEPLAAGLVAGCALLFARGVQPLSEEIVTLAALIVLVPGLTMTVATVELTTRHLVSGTARLAGALTTFLMIALGLALGRTLAGIAPLEAVEVQVQPLPTWGTLAAVALAPLAFAVLFQARVREFGWIWVASVAGLAASTLGARVSPEVGPLLGALVVGLLAHFYARRVDRPAQVLLTPGILMLVPGSIGYRALDLFLSREALAGTEAFFRMAIVSVALAGGLLLAGALLPPRRSL